MAFRHGKDTEIWLNGIDVSSYFNSIDFGVDVDTAETTTFKKSWKTHIPGMAAATADASGLYDPAFDNVYEVLNVESGAILTILPGGGLARMFNVHSTTYKESAAVGDAVAFSWSVIGSAQVGLGAVLAQMVTVTADGNGSAVDGGAATTNGAIAHLHVASVSASDSILVTIEDSATGSSGWATIGTFASKSAPGAESINIPGTVRRYTRAVYDVTGTDVSIVVGVALARL